MCELICLQEVQTIPVYFYSCSEKVKLLDLILGFQKCSFYSPETISDDLRIILPESALLPHIPMYSLSLMQAENSPELHGPLPVEGL